MVLLANVAQPMIEPAETGLDPLITVVVCTHDGATHLPGVLASLAAQTLDPRHRETIVVDDGSRDASAAIAAEHGVRVVRLAENHGLAAARNAGVREARAPLVAFTDDDCVCDPAWAQTLLAAFEDAGVVAAGGSVRPDGPDSFLVRYLRRRNPLLPLSAVLLAAARPAQRLGLYLSGLLRGPRRLDAGESLYSVVGANMAFRRATLIALDGFDEAFRFGGEEEELCRRLSSRATGERIVFVPAATVTHLFRPQTRDTLRRSRAYGRGNARLAAKHPEVRAIVFPIPAAMLAGLGLALMRRRSGPARRVMLLPLLAYPRWLPDALRARSAEPIAYPYLQLLQEIATMVGEVEGRRSGYRAVPASQLEHPDLSPMASSA